MKKLISIILTLSIILTIAPLQSYADTNSAHSIGIKYPEICVGVVDRTDRGTTESITVDTLPVIKVVPNPSSENKGILALDNYGANVQNKKIDLDLYKYVTIFYKYENVYDDVTAPTIYIASHNGEIVGGAQSKHIRTDTYSGGWRCTVVEIPTLKYLNPENKHFLDHFHVYPFGRVNVQNVDKDMRAYIHGITFHTDIPDETVVSAPYMEGYDDGTFGASRYMTKAEVCAVTARLLGNEQAEGFEGTTRFTDVSKGKWYYGFVAYCESIGLLSAFGNKLSPEDYITADEFFDILLKSTIKVPDSAKNGSFTENFNALPDKYITRAQAASFINALYDKNKTSFASETELTFADATREMWAYEDIITASSAFAYYREKNSNEYKLVYKDYTQIEVPPSDEEYALGEKKLAEVENREMVRIVEIQSTETDVDVWGARYYFASNGDDKNSGRTPENPKRTIEALKNLELDPGDAVFFNRGDTFRGTFTAVEGVTYSSYGTGAKPILTASPANFAGASNWESTDVPNVWKLTTPITHDVGLVVFNNGEAWSEKRIKGRPDFLAGDLWDLDKDLTMWHDVKTPTNDTGYLYLRSDLGNPGKRFDSIEVSPRDHIIKATNDILVDNICFKYTGAHAIGAGTIRNLVVQNCEFYFIGGSWFRTDTLSRYGNAVEVYGSCDGYIVDNCYITQVYDAGVTHQYSNGEGLNLTMKNIKYTNNVITDTTYPVEYFFAEPNEGVTHMMENVEISGNIIMRTGFGFGDQRPDKNAATAIKGWNTYNEAYNYTLKNNIFALSKYYLMAVAAGDEAWAPVCDSNTFIQYYNGEFGSMLYRTSSKYNSNILDFIKETSGDKNAKAYFLPPLETE
ncbi:MAG: hypothetical protein IKU43_09275 [Clostridia bacterium]|nr:hypothetical protein [Clostridia bacterium]